MEPWILMYGELSPYVLGDGSTCNDGTNQGGICVALAGVILPAVALSNADGTGKNSS